MAKKRNYHICIDNKLKICDLANFYQQQSILRMFFSKTH